MQNRFTNGGFTPENSQEQKGHTDKAIEEGVGSIARVRINVEHVVREEKTVAAYELVGIYCELLVARLGVIESQKTCPNDLKEAVASVLYASKRLSGVQELADIVKHFTAKYGKDFVSAAVGLQPDSGVSRLLKNTQLKNGEHEHSSTDDSKLGLATILWFMILLLLLIYTNSVVLASNLPKLTTGIGALAMLGFLLATAGLVFFYRCSSECKT